MWVRWQDHTQDNTTSLIRQLNSGINGLALVAKRASFKNRLMLAEGMVLSKLGYLIQIWGGSSDFLLKSLQVLLNKTARIVTRKSWFPLSRILMKECNWLSVQQLVQYHTLVSVFNIVNTKRPKYLYDKMCTTVHQYNTRTTVKYGENYTGKSSLAMNSFCYRGSILFNRLQIEIRETVNAATFKKKAKEWIRANIMI